MVCFARLSLLQAMLDLDCFSAKVPEHGDDGWESLGRSTWHRYPHLGQDSTHACEAQAPQEVRLNIVAEHADL
jgi:hypothetical protein